MGLPVFLVDVREEKMKISHAVFNDEVKKMIPHPLIDHLQGVAKLAERFTSVFANGDWGKAAGLLHDLGKGSPEFQKYIRDVTGYDRDGIVVESTRKWPHSTHGAILANENWQGPAGKILAYLLAGHHGGLPDYHKEVGGGNSLNNRLTAKEIGKLPKLDGEWVNKITQEVSQPMTLPCGRLMKNHDAFHLWIRMLFSSLVDADFLNTEKFMDEKKFEQRGKYLSIKELKVRFDEYMAKLVADAKWSEVNDLRQQILAECRQAGELKSGFFDLTVPTGGGKTLSGMAFALEHAVQHKKDRIIVVIPYTSIIEQTAAIYKQIFGDENVIEHHSSLDPEKESLQARLASENWDAPIIVTTNVQLFESLFAARTSRCRKLHNIANSVIICDEAQMLPPEYLKPILSAMKGLVDYFDTSIVLCTATQPALTGDIGSGQEQFQGIEEGVVRAIMSDHQKLSRKFQRVIVEKGEHYTDWQLLGHELGKYQQVLCVVNTRKDCRDLHALMPEGTVLLSANLCGEHRSMIISRIKDSLEKQEPVRVISTQLVESGVDIDFPVVYRAMAGFDSIAQAAGRCNREGKLEKNGKNIKGKVVVFQTPKPAPPGFLRKSADAGSEIMRLNPEDCENLRPDIFLRYFKLFYGNGIASFDQKDMHSLLVKDAGRGEFQFRTAARKFKLIDDQNQVSVVVWYSGEKTTGQQLIGQLKKYGPSRKLLRKMQRFTVTIPERKFSEIQDSVVEEVEGLWCQAVDYAYDDTLGFVGLDMDQNDGAIFI
jgi:CRISPR-associated endonuclease/helicase Cas3